MHISTACPRTGRSGSNAIGPFQAVGAVSFLLWPCKGLSANAAMTNVNHSAIRLKFDRSSCPLGAVLKGTLMLALRVITNELRRTITAN